MSQAEEARECRNSGLIPFFLWFMLGSLQTIKKGLQLNVVVAILLSYLSIVVMHHQNMCLMTNLHCYYAFLQLLTNAFHLAKAIYR
jgi:hypothetical protein